MNRFINQIKSNRIIHFLESFDIICYSLGIKYIWKKDVKFSAIFISLHNKFLFASDIITLLACISIIGSFYTQNSLSQKQENDRRMFSVLPITFTSFYILVYYKHEIRKLLRYVVIVLKEHHNDIELEHEMVKKIKVYFFGFTGLFYGTIFSHGLNSLYSMITKGEEFITFTAAWPEIHDTSMMARVVRVFNYLWWYFMSSKIACRMGLLVVMMVTIHYQFKNLQSYFYSLDNIFRDKTLSQEEKELKYEKAFKLGIKMHSLTLWCTQLHKRICNKILTSQVLMYFVAIMTQLIIFLVGERNLSVLFTTILSSIATCLDLGIFMWNGGDITIEASKLSEAMYSSGWQNCQGQSSVRIRKLMIISMTQAQQPVVYKAFGVIILSYESYVNLIKLPYSLVSLFY